MNSLRFLCSRDVLCLYYTTKIEHGLFCIFLQGSYSLDAPELCRRFRICIILAVELTILTGILSQYILDNFCVSVLKHSDHHYSFLYRAAATKHVTIPVMYLNNLRANHWNVCKRLKSQQLTYLLTYLPTYLLTPWCRVLLEKLTGLQLVKKFPAFHGTRRFITALTSVRHLSLSWASPIQSIYQHPTSWWSVLILSIHLRLGLRSGLFPSGFPTKTLYTPFSSPIRATCPEKSQQHGT